ncbi:MULTISPECIES: HAD-IA family hydrolase [unclassified Rhizobium]|uniref:HAD-IA family hydrolase n=1 Tax=unclassified Rhizobium TaxID=2613769 RepID=UPI001ADC8502|nr:MULTISPECIES: HAD-IA family hydrolase [unclassified Rhizobium]QXZ82343.1 HAD-IA family hydrolase [Rhizobium sp. K1/93]QXZ95615.1 HAD-IA family hydrolase [Rhizobium sp. B230/85]QYA02684.1 HAD-IA family hydrolase [Rhizobium sp. B21/90]MBO9099375.1 HAD-IA family hydrolase [Rhizobium sp. L58/93]MBO9131819.1 HAD-IA family hydrolase [Rhizobium sp. B209b/85]
MSADNVSVFDKSYAAFLFDMDGTIMNSIASAERVWGAWAARQGLDVEKFMPTMHGARGIDTIRNLNLPGVDPAVEAAAIERDEIADVAGVVPISGAIDFLASLPADRWAIVTSSPIALAKARLAEAGIPMPRFIVTAEDVKVGKPNPQCYILGAERLGVSVTECLVFEDVPAGIKAGEAAGADVMVITATHSHPMQTPHTTILNYDNVSARIGANGKLSVVRA